MVVDMVKDMARAPCLAMALWSIRGAAELFSRALMHARTMGCLRIFVHPGDASRLDPDWRDFQVTISGQRIQIVPTDSVHPGGCFIEGDHGAVDARIETRMGAVMSVFEHQPRNRPNHDPASAPDLSRFHQALGQVIRSAFPGGLSRS